MELAGRERELSALGQALDDVSAGTTRLLGVIGEAGIGKSALLAEIDRLARERGLTVLHRRAAVQEHYVPYATVDGISSRSSTGPRSCSSTTCTGRTSRRPTSCSSS